MEYTLEAIYEGGVFKPMKSLKIPDHQRVTITVHHPRVENPNGKIESWQQVYAGLSDQDIVEIESLALDRSHFLAQEDG